MIFGFNFCFAAVGDGSSGVFAVGDGSSGEMENIISITYLSEKLYNVCYQKNNEDITCVIVELN